MTGPTPGSTVTHRRGSVRRRVVLLAVAVALPLTALAAWRALDRRQSELRALEAEARETLATVVSELEAQIESSEAMLLGISRLIDVTAPPERNDAVLRELFAAAPFHFANVWVTDAAGRNVGILRQPPGGRDAAHVRDRATLGRVLDAGRFDIVSVSRSLVLPGRPFVLTLLLPLRRPSPSAAPPGLVGASIALDSLKALQVARRLPSGSVITVQDSLGRVLMRTLDPEHWIGREYGATEGFRAVMALGEGVDMLQSADGVRRQIAFRVMPRPRWVVYVGIPEDATIAVAQRQFVVDLAVGIVMTLLVLVVAVRQVDRIVEPIASVTADATAIAAGDDTRRSRIDTPDEIGDLARAVNRMAETAVAQRRAIETDVERRRATERALEESREQLRQAQKMDAMGSFAGGIAHDFNNYLSSIVGFAEMALTQLDREPKARADVEHVLAAAHRAAELTKQILVFSRRSVVEPQVLDVSDVVRGIGKLLVPLLGEGVSFDLALAAEPEHIRVDKGQLEQVIVNLATNARDAMPDGGRFTLTTARVRIEDADAAHPGVPPGEWVTLTAADSGIGMSPEVRERIFEPFFTTKERGRGTGLGLALVYSMVQQAGGLIRVDSTRGAGSVFRLYFRRVASGAFAAVADAAPAVGGGHGERILVAEDDDAVRAMTTQQLERAGYVVTSVPDGVAALQVLQGDDTFDLLLTDAVMPGLHARALLARVREMMPALPVLIMSGYADDDALVRDVVDASVPYLSKPFTAQQLLRRVHDTLQRAGDRGLTASTSPDGVPPAPAA